jgi:hypothetical protein
MAAIVADAAATVAAASSPAAATGVPSVSSTPATAQHQVPHLVLPVATDIAAALQQLKQKDEQLKQKDEQFARLQEEFSKARIASAISSLPAPSSSPPPLSAAAAAAVVASGGETKTGAGARGESKSVAMSLGSGGRAMARNRSSTPLLLRLQQSTASATAPTARRVRTAATVSPPTPAAAATPTGGLDRGLTVDDSDEEDNSVAAPATRSGGGASLGPGPSGLGSVRLGGVGPTGIDVPIFNDHVAAFLQRLNLSGLQTTDIYSSTVWEHRRNRTEAQLLAAAIDALLFTADLGWVLELLVRRFVALHTYETATDRSPSAWAVVDAIEVQGATSSILPPDHLSKVLRQAQQLARLRAPAASPPAAAGFSSAGGGRGHGRRNRGRGGSFASASTADSVGQPAAAAALGQDSGRRPPFTTSRPPNGAGAGR